MILRQDPVERIYRRTEQNFPKILHIRNHTNDQNLELIADRLTPITRFPLHNIMKRKKRPERFHPDKYKDGPRNPPKTRSPRPEWDDENLDEAIDEWLDMRSWNDSDEDDWDDAGEEE